MTLTDALNKIRLLEEGADKRFSNSGLNNYNKEKGWGYLGFNWDDEELHVKISTYNPDHPMYKKLLELLQEKK